VRLDPYDAWTYNIRGLAYGRLRQHEKAIADFNEAIRLDPRYITALNNRGFAHASLGQHESAARDFNLAIRVDPRNADAHNGLAWQLSTAREPQIRNGRLAVELARKACELTQWKNANHLDTLAAAYAEAGQFEEAVRWQQAALAFPEFEKQAGEAARKRLALYQEGKPYHN
jgi:tetratricopeptide (TPR) repeat protein